VPVSGLPDIALVIAIFLVLLVPLAAIGIAFINVGLGRAHSAAHLMLASLCAFAIAGGVYFICGFAWQGYIDLPSHTILIGGKPWNWIAAVPFFFRHFPPSGSPASVAACLELFSVSLAALIPLGAGIDRWRLSAICASTALLAGVTYPLFAHWVWGGGWLAQLGVNYGMGYGFLDAGGAGTIQVVGGLTALSIAWLLGPRRGKYSPDGMPTAIPGHNVVFVMMGCLLALVGWLGLNSAGAILFAGVEPGRTILISINTTLAAGAAGLAAALITRLRFGRTDVSISANGWVGGLVASSAACAFIAPAAAVFLGLVAGVLVTFSVEWFELRFAVDDPGGSVSVHAVGGLWGLLALGLLARFSSPIANISPATFSSLPSAASPALTGTGQWVAQLVGVATLLGFVLPLTYGLNCALNLVCPHRIAPEGERQGLDLYELGAGAYPEFVTHSDEFTQR
jgi:ammonium transporter, Amt family